MIIRAIDFETTGLPSETATDHAIVEIGWCDIGGTPQAILCKPARSIECEAMAVHHITEEDVAEATGDLSALGTPDYFAAHGADFEQKFFTPTAPMICTYKVAVRLWPDAPAHGLQFLRYHLPLVVDRNLATPPHRAGPDAYLCAALMQAILDHSAAPSLEEMVRWSSGPALLPRVTFGKHYGKKWEELPTDYLEWIVYKSDMERDVMANAKHHLKRRREETQ